MSEIIHTQSVALPERVKALPVALLELEKTDPAGLVRRDDHRLQPGAIDIAEKIVLRFNSSDLKTQALEAIDRLEPFHTTELKRLA